MRVYKESSWFLHSNFSTMSGRISCRYLLFYLCVSAILACGLSRRIPRRASCPSCSKDCPEALTVQLPWHSRQESDWRSGIPRDLSINQNSLYSRLMQGRMSQDTFDDNSALLNKNAVSFGNYRSFPQHVPTNGNSIFNKYRTNSQFPAYVDRTTSQDNFANVLPREYPPVYVSPPRPFFGRLENFLRNPRNQNSEFPLENRNVHGYKEDEDPANKMLVVHRDDRNTEPSWENLKDTSTSNVILPHRSFPNVENAFRLHRQDILDEEKSTIEKTAGPANQEYDSNFAYPGKEYFSTNFDVREIKPYVFPQSVRKSTRNEELFDDWDTNDLLQSSNLRQLTQTEDNFLRMHSADKQETIIPEANNDRFEQNSYTFPQELNIWQPTEKEEQYFNNWNIGARKNSQESAETKQLQKVDYNWLYPATNIGHFIGEEDEKYFENGENMNHDYFDDDIETDIVMPDRNSYNPFQDMNNWRSGRIQDKELSDNLDLAHGNLQDVQKEKQLEIYSNKNNNHFQNEGNEHMNIDKMHSNADQIAPSVNASLFTRFLDILNKSAYPAESSKTQELSKPKTNVQVNSNDKRNKRLYKDETIKDDVHEDPAPSSNILYIRKYKNPFVDTQNVKINNQSEVLTKFDPDLLGDIEGPPTEPIEPTSTDFSVEFSTPTRQQ